MFCFINQDNWNLYIYFCDDWYLYPLIDDLLMLSSFSDRCFLSSSSSNWWSFYFQPMEIYVDDEAKLTLHGLVQVCFVTFYSPVVDLGYIFIKTYLFLTSKNCFLIFRIYLPGVSIFVVIGSLRNHMLLYMLGLVT